MNSPIITATVAGKSVRLEDLPPEAFRIVVGEQGATSDQQLYSKVWALFAGVNLRANTVASMPFEIRRGDTVVTSSENYEDVTKMLPRPRHTFERIEAALTIWGSAYFEKGKNVARKPRDLFYLLPTSVKPKFDEESGELTKFVRTVKRGNRFVEKDFAPDEILYLWAEDPFVELGPPKSSPFIAAMASAKVLLNIDQFAAQFFERGALRGTILALDGNPNESDRERIKSLWRRVMSGLKNAFGEMVINAKSMTPVVVGDGLDSLKQGELTEERALAIATAFKIPYSLMFSDAANYATSENDKQSFYENLIIPECEFIAEELNAQYFAPAGYRLVFTPESLDIFQEDEEQRSASLLQWVSAIERDPETALIGMDLLGFEIPEDVRGRIEALAEEKKAAREAQLQQGEAQPGADRPDEAQPGQLVDEAKSDLDKWQRKALKRLGAGKGAACDFESDVLEPFTVGQIRALLEQAETGEDVKAVFEHYRGKAGETLVYPLAGPDRALGALAAELKRANDLLERSMEDEAQ
jgi:HK97 family phage portal protein